MRRSNISLTLGFSIFAALFCVFALLGQLPSTASAQGNEDTFEFTNNEADDAYDLHIEWSRAVTVKKVSPFKKTTGSGTNSSTHKKGTVKQGDTASVTVTWDGSDPSIDKWWWTKEDGSRLGEEKKGNPTIASLHTGASLQKITFDTLQGQVVVYLPDDMMAGDTISGTVIAEPKGQNETERSQNRATQNARALMLGDQKVSLSQPQFTWTLPRPDSQQPARYSLRIVEVTSGKEIGRTIIAPLTEPLNVVRPQTPAPGDFHLPALGQTGRPVEIIGPFDGNAANTTLSVGGQSVTPLAESPHKCVFNSPANVIGPVELSLKEAGVETKGEYHNVDVRLKAPKTTLLKDESLILTVEVSGLAGNRGDVPMQLDSKGVIQMEGGNFQNISIRPQEITQDGRYTTTRRITGRQAGAFSVTATLIVQPFDVCLRDDAQPGTMLQLNSFTGAYIFILPGKVAKSGGQVGEEISRVKVTGAGKVEMKGCIITLQHKAPDRRVSATLDTCAKSGNASVQAPNGQHEFTISDRDATNNGCVYTGGANAPAGGVRTGLSDAKKEKIINDASGWTAEQILARIKQLQKEIEKVFEDSWFYLSDSEKAEIQRLQDEIDILKDEYKRKAQP